MHYKDGTPAAIGDQVYGKAYNTDHPIAGVIVAIKPGSDACNCEVAFNEVVELENIHQAANRNGLVHSYHDPSDGKTKYRLVIPKVDYSQCDYFLKVV